MFAPIVLFVYNRPLHTQQLLDSLANNKEAIECDLYVYCDGPKNLSEEEHYKKIKETRNIVNNEKRFKTVTIVEQPKNKGLANSIIDGVTEILKRYETVIVLEDDLIVSPYFLYYMNESLQRYKHNSKVGQIGACNFFACGSRFPLLFLYPFLIVWVGLPGKTGGILLTLMLPNFLISCQKKI